MGRLPSPAALPGVSGLSLVFFLQPPPSPFLEMEQLRLVKQLAGLRARLALGAREDVIPKLSSEVQEEGRDPGSRQGK